MVLMLLSSISEERLKILKKLIHNKIQNFKSCFAQFELKKTVDFTIEFKLKPATLEFPLPTECNVTTLPSLLESRN